MKNIIKVFLNDCKHIGRNVVALVVVMPFSLTGQILYSAKFISLLAY